MKKKLRHAKAIPAKLLNGSARFFVDRHQLAKFLDFFTKTQAQRRKHGRGAVGGSQAKKWLLVYQSGVVLRCSEVCWLVVASYD